MSLPLLLQSYAIDDFELEIYVPDLNAVQQLYKNSRNAAYWARVWPASIGLCRFLKQNPKYITGKTVLELAAGLGLSGLYSARHAETVTITDIEPQAEEIIHKSAAHLKLSNVQANTLNWNDAPLMPMPGVVLLSDVNYEPAVFNELKAILIYYLKNNVSVIISTPQRLVAKPFINSLLPHCTQQWDSIVTMDNSETNVSVFVLEAV
mgnify:CR=1 FL=1